MGAVPDNKRGDIQIQRLIRGRGLFQGGGVVVPGDNYGINFDRIVFT